MMPVLELLFCEIAGNPWDGRATVRFQGEQGDPFPVREGLTSRQRDEIRWYIEDYMDFPEGGNEIRAQQVEAHLAAYGRSLWDALQGPAVQTWLGAVQAAGAGRLELRAKQLSDEVAFRTPWELMRVGLSSQSPGTLLQQLGVSVVRRVNANLPMMTLPDTSTGLRILTIVCRPEDAGFLDPRYTPEAILGALAERPEVSVDFCRPGTLAALVDMLQRAADAGQPYHVVHFDGHGDYLAAEGGVGILCFEKDDGSTDPVRAQPFGDLMARFRVPLVVLEACRTATKFFAQDTVAGALLRQGVGTVVAMGHAVHVDMTRRLMAGFYGVIARGRPLGEAIQAGRNQLRAAPGRRLGTDADAKEIDLQDWFVPQLYQGGVDPVLLSGKPKRRKARPVPPFEGFGDPPRAGFQGRGYELHRLERALLRNRVVVVHAPGGMGKTALVREAAHWWVRTGLFLDGAVFVSFERTQSPAALVNELGQALEGIDFLKRSPEEKETWLGEEFDQRRMLMVWDNYESVLPSFNAKQPAPAEYARFARRWTERGTRILVTSRDPSAGLDAWPFPLGELSKSEALLLLVRFLDRLGIDRMQRVQRGLTPEMLAPIYDRTCGHPLALELLAPYIVKLGAGQVAAEVGALLAKATQEHPEERNRNMWASLQFSIQHLSEAARNALPAVALLAGGCLEDMAPAVAGLDATAWSAVREELEHRGLVRIQGALFLPHPVLGEIEQLAPSGDLFKRFIGVILAFCAEFDKLARSADTKAGLLAMGRCEAVVRRAIGRALGADNQRTAWFMADSLQMFLKLTGRANEGASLITDLHHRVSTSETEEIGETNSRLTREAAWARAATDTDGAVEQLNELLVVLDAVQVWDTRQERACAKLTLGRINYEVRGRPADAIEPLREAESLFAQLENEGLINSTNRAVTLGDLANAFGSLGRYAEAHDVAGRGLTLDRQRNDTSAKARAQGRIANILMSQGRLQEAENCYNESIRTAEDAGDDEVIGIVAQHLAGLALKRDRLEEAIRLLQTAVTASERAGNERGKMQAFNLLGNVERRRNNLTAALAWYARTLEIAEKLDNVEGQTAARSNRANVLSTQAARITDPRESRRLLSEAVAENLDALALENQLGRPEKLANLHSNHAGFLRLAGQFGEAQSHAEQALAIFEKIQAPGTWRTLDVLEKIAAARGDATAATDYRRRKEAAFQEAEERAGTPPLPAKTVAAFLKLALTARGRGDTLLQALAAVGADDNLLATIDKRDPWLSAHLRALAERRPRPTVEVPQAFIDLLNQAWEAGDT